MKKLLSILLCFNILVSPVYAKITDDFVKQTLDKSLVIHEKPYIFLNDEFVEKSLDKNLEIKKNKQPFIQDDFAENNPNKTVYAKPIINYNEIIPELPENYVIPSNRSKFFIESENTIPVKVKIQKKFSTRSKKEEGEYLDFILVEDVKINDKTYPANTIVKARIETVSKNKAWGVPADLVVGNFSLDNMQLYGEISKTGANRSFWVRPAFSLTLGIWGIGFLFIPIRGGHAKISPRKTYILYAEP